MSDALQSDEKVPVSSSALFEVLMALNGPEHLIRELQVTRDRPPVLTGNPIDLLIKQYNEFVTGGKNG